MIRILAAAMLLCLISSQVYAEEPGAKEEPVKPNSDDCSEVSTILKGSPAPCNGILWPEPWTKEAVSCLLIELPTAKRLIEYQKQVYTAALKNCHKTVEALKEGQCNCEETIREVVAPETVWYEHPAFWGVVGAVLGVGTTVLGYELSK